MAEEQQVAEAPAETTAGQAPSGDWKANLPEEIKNNQLIHNMDSVEGLARSAIHAQSMVGAEKIAVPGKWATDADWAQAYDKLGRPENAEGYTLTAPEGATVDKDLEGWFKNVSYDAGLNAKQAEKIYTENLNKTAEMSSEQAGPSLEVQQAEAELALKKEYGKAYDAKIKAAKGVLNEFAPEGFDQLLSKDGIPLGNHPDFVRIMAKIGSHINKITGEDKIVGPKDTLALTPADADKEISLLRGDPRDKGPYWDKRHPDHERTVAEVQRLMEYVHPQEDSA